jgi:hypothetical protein
VTARHQGRLGLSAGAGTTMNQAGLYSLPSERFMGARSGSSRGPGNFIHSFLAVVDG